MTAPRHPRELPSGIMTPWGQLNWIKLLEGTWRLDRRRFHDAEVVQVYCKRGVWFMESRTHSPVAMPFDDVRRMLHGAVIEKQEAV